MSKNSLVLHLRRRRNTAAEKKANGVFLIISRFRGKHQARLNWQSSLSSVITAKEGTGMLASISDWFRGRCAGLPLSSAIFLDHAPHYPLRQVLSWNLELASRSRMVATESRESCLCLSSAEDTGATACTFYIRAEDRRLSHSYHFTGWASSLAPQQRQLLKCVQADRWGPPLWTPRLPV